MLRFLHSLLLLVLSKMLSTPKSLKLGFYRNPYNRVSFVRNGRNNDNIPDGEPLQGTILYVNLANEL